jgi:uncharacterized membrane protein YsdA (DUF1294 family)
MTRLLALWLLAMSALAMVLFGLDKWKAKAGLWRIPEAALWASAALGGGVGATVGMRVFHHKTHKGLFPIGLPALAVLQLALLAWTALGCPIGLTH